MLEASTFKDKEIINLAKNNFINLKINAETQYGIPLFNRFNGTGYPLILFLDSNGNELDRISGYLPDYEFRIKMQNILNGKNTFTYYLDEYNKNNHSSEILFALANKYKEKNEVDKAISLYKQLLNSSNVSKSDYDNSKYSLAILSIQKNNTALILEYLNENPYSNNVEIAVFELINYYKSQQMNFEEIELYNKYLKKLNFSKKDYYLGIRPEHFNVSENNEYSFNPKVDLIENLGNEKIAYIKIDQYEISAKISSKHNIDNTIGFNSKDIFVFDETGKRIKS